jgi:hypothetical protein
MASEVSEPKILGRFGREIITTLESRSCSFGAGSSASRKEKTMKRLILIIAVLLTLTGCPQKESSEQERLAQQRVELEEARRHKEFWQTTATILGCLVMLALAAGTVLGSKAKEDSEK